MNADQTNSRSKRHRRSGFTLVEMLVALLLSGIVLSAAGRITVSLLRSEQATSRRLRTNLQRSVAFDTFVADWDARIADADHVDVYLDASLRPVVEMIVLDTVAGADAVARRLPARVTYHVELSEHTDSTLQLMRDVDLLVGHDPVRTETVACHVQSIEVLVLRDGAWQSPTPPRRGRDTNVDAFRISLVWSDGETQSRLSLVEGGS